MTPTRAVLFDFGGTLHQYASGGPIADASVLTGLARTAGAEPTPDAVAAASRAATRRVYTAHLRKPYYLHRDFFAEVVGATLTELGVDVTPELLRRYQELRSAARTAGTGITLREGVFETIDTLRERGTHVGIVSNTDEEGFRETMATTGLEGRLDSILTSEEAQSCKPDRRIYEIALERAGSPDPGAVLFVGDSLDQDVAGARALGLRTALIWSRVDREPPDRDPRPDHIIRAIPEVLDLAAPPA